ncbi:hypothetical protein EYF80_039330 [Liparis tanakae]|uniref:Uncharacterized protein n=1 Tax=Liparis tanakae TaxID=230148 RepID=A0A4Z2GB82_9TELE|nr:hypothetical protein EYF80_039330 [Liparis tanakae]
MLITRAGGVCKAIVTQRGSAGGWLHITRKQCFKVSQLALLTGSPLEDRRGGDRSQNTSRTSLNLFRERQFYLQHLSHLGPLLGRVLGLDEQLLQQRLFVKLTHQLALQMLLHKVDQEVHHRLGHAADTQHGDTKLGSHRGN